MFPPKRPRSWFSSRNHRSLLACQPSACPGSFQAYTRGGGRICIPQGRLPHVKPRRNTRDSSDASHHRHSQRRSDFEIASRHSLETALPLHRRVHGCSCHRIPTRMTLRHTTYRSVGCRIPGVAGREKAGGRRRGEMGQEIEGSPLLG